jgi:hypothetical protein
MANNNNSSTARRSIGWREWVELPELGIAHIKAKIDTGARTSALHAFAVDPFQEKGVQMVRFSLHPLQKRVDVVHHCTARVVDRRWVSDSGGHREQRWVIETPIRLGDIEWRIELTLTNRDSMLFRMLLGRTAMGKNFQVQPDRSYLQGTPP